MTRLRLTLRDESRADSAAIPIDSRRNGVIVSDEQFQVVLGPGKAQTAAEMTECVTGRGPGGCAIAGRCRRRKETGAEEQANQRYSKIPREIPLPPSLHPLIPGFIAVGLLLGFATLAEQIFVLENAHPNATLMVQLIGYMKVFSKGMFTFLSILIGYNAQKAFGGSGVNGAIIAAPLSSAITRKPPAASIPEFRPSSATYRPARQ